MCQPGFRARRSLPTAWSSTAKYKNEWSTKSAHHTHNLNALTGRTRHQVDRSTAHAWLPQSHSLVPKRGKAPSVPRLMKYDVCSLGVVELTAQAYRENGPRPISVQRRAVAASIWNNPPAASDEWRNPRCAAVARLRGAT